MTKGAGPVRAPVASREREDADCVLPVGHRQTDEKEAAAERKPLMLVTGDGAR